MKTAVLAATALAVSVASAFPITAEGVKCRSGPGTSYDIKDTYAKNTDVTLKCQTEGETISGNSIWDKTQDGCYVSDYYVKTGSNGYVVDECDGGCTAPKVNSATVDLIGSWEGFKANICEYQCLISTPRVVGM